MDSKQRELIESIIKQHPDYIGHENLMEQFCAEVYKKSYLLLDSVSNIESLKNYLTKVADTSIANVLKNFHSNNTIQTLSHKKAIEIEPIQIKKVVEPKEITDNRSIRVQKSPQQGEQDRYSNLIDPEEFISEKYTNPEIAKSILDVIDKLDLGNPSKKYLEIFTMRYVQNLRQSVIARKLKISQADLSKRFCEMVKLIKQQLG